MYLWQKKILIEADEDVFHAFLVKNASYDGNLEMPCIKAEDAVPQNVITFSKAVRSNCTSPADSVAAKCK